MTTKNSKAKINKRDADYYYNLGVKSRTDGIIRLSSGSFGMAGGLTLISLGMADFVSEEGLFNLPDRNKVTFFTSSVVVGFVMMVVSGFAIPRGFRNLNQAEAHFKRAESLRTSFDFQPLVEPGYKGNTALGFKFSMKF